MNIDQSPPRGQDLVRRILVTIGALAVYWFGQRIILPGVDIVAFAGRETSVLDDLGRYSIVMLGVTPLYSVLILLEIISLVLPSLRRLPEAAPRESAMLLRFVFCAALALAGMQAWRIATIFEGLPHVVAEPGFEFRLEVTIALIGATACLGWIAAQVTIHGLGNGFWLLLSAPFILTLPALFLRVLEFSRMGQIDANSPLVVLAYFVASAGVLTFVARIRDRALAPAPPDPFTLVWPVILADLVSAPTIYGVSLLTQGGAANLLATLRFAGAGRLAIHAALVVLFMLWRGATTRAPGVNRREAFRADLLGGVALALACAVGEWLTPLLRLNFALDGTGLVILIATGLAIANSLGFGARKTAAA